LSTSASKLSKSSFAVIMRADCTWFGPYSVGLQLTEGSSVGSFKLFFSVFLRVEAHQGRAQKMAAYPAV
jgi:hypothetical protein